MNGSTGSGAVNAAGGSLSGTGVIAGPVTIQPGGVLWPGNNSIGTLTINNSLVLSGAAVMLLNKDTLSNNAVVGLTSVTYGGILNVTNIGATPLADSDSFQLFSAGSYSGMFANIVPSPGPSLAWNTSTLATDGKLRVSAVSGAPVISSIIASGSNLLLGGSNGTSAGYYYVVASTNLSSPLSNWTVMGTNLFDVNGGFQTTNPINPVVPEQFFILQVP